MPNKFMELEAELKQLIFDDQHLSWDSVDRQLKVLDQLQKILGEQKLTEYLDTNIPIYGAAYRPALRLMLWDKSKILANLGNPKYYHPSYKTLEDVLYIYYKISRGKKLKW